MQRYLLFMWATIFLAGALLFSIPGFGQDNNSELFQQITGMEDNIEKVDELINLSVIYRKTSLDTSIICCDLAIKISQSIEYTKGEAEANYKKSFFYSKKDQYISAIEYAKIALEKASSLKDSTIIAKANYLLGNLTRIQSDNKPSYKFYLEALKIYYHIKDTHGLKAVYNGLGNYFSKIGIYNSAAIYYDKSLQLAEAKGDTENQGKILSNLGSIYFKLKKYSLSKKYLEISLEIAKMYPENGELANVLSRLGNIELNIENFANARSYYSQVDSICRANDDIRNIHNCNINFGNLYMKQGEYQKSLEKFEGALAYFREQDIAEGVIAAWQGIAELNNLMADIQTSIIYYDSCLQLAKKTNDLARLEQIYSSLYLIYQNGGRSTEALNYYIEYNSVKDSIYNLNALIVNYELDLLYEKEKKDLQIASLKIDQQKKTRQRNAFLGIGLSLIFIATLLLFFFRYRARKNQVISEQRILQLQEEKKLMAARFLVEGQENERKRIASAIHDSLGVLLSTSKMHITAIKDDNAENRVLIDKATKFLDEANTEMRKISHNMMPGALSKLGLCEALEDLFETLDETEGIDARMEVLGPKERLPENQEIMIYRVVQEMVNNSLKHSRAERIDLTLVIHPDELDLSYSDNGKGFDVEEVMAKKTMGIQSIRSRVKFLDGIIKIDSAPGKGVVYRISVPVDTKRGLTSI